MSDDTGTFAPANGATVTIDAQTARIIRDVFVPHNPRKMRNCDERVRQAAFRFIEAAEHPVPPGPLFSEAK